MGGKLAVDIGESTTAAAVDRNGQRTAIVFADRLTVPTPAVIDGQGNQVDLITALTTARADDAEPVVAALAEHLRTVATAARTVDDVVVTTPPGWGPRRQQLVSQAAKAAGLPTPQLVNAAAAIAAHTHPTAAAGSTVLVICADQHATSTTVVQRDGTGWTRAATQPVPAATGDRLDLGLAALAGIDPASAEQIDDQLHAARQSLNSQQTAAIVLPGRPTPLLLTPQMFATAVEPLQAAIADAAADTLDAAGVDNRRVLSIVVHGALAATLTPPETLAERFGVAATTAADGRLAAVYGALAAPADPTTAVRRAVRAAWSGTQLLAPIAAVLAGTLLQWQVFDTVNRLMPPDIYRHTFDYASLLVYFDTAAFATAGWISLHGVLAAARLIAATLVTDPTNTKIRLRQSGQIYAFAAVVGLALACLQGLLAQAILGGPPGLAPPYLTAALAAAILPAAVAMTVGLAAPWLSKPPPWTQRLHHPTAAVLLAAGGIAAATARSSGLPIQGVPHLVQNLLGLFGAGLLGVAIALTVVANRYARLILGGLMGIASMIIIGFSNLRSATVIYLIAVGLWWIRRATRIALDNLPPRLWRRLTVADTDAERASP